MVDSKITIKKTLVIKNAMTDYNHKIFNHMTKVSKNVYNCVIYCFSIFLKYKYAIYRRLNSLIVQFRNRKKLSGEIIDKWFYDIFESYYNNYSEICTIKKHNNEIIYKYIIDKIENDNIYIENDNLDDFRKTVYNDLSNLENLKHEHTDETIIEVVDNILKSIYIKNWYDVQHKLKNNIPINGVSEQFIEDVKNKKFLFKSKVKIDYKKKINNIISKEIDCKLKSNQNYVTRIAYKHLHDNSEMLPSDIIVNIMNKAFENIKAYYQLKANGIKCNLPKYLQKDSKFNLYFTYRSFKENNKDVRLTIGKYVSENYIDITGNNSVVCVNPTANTVYKKYAPKTACIDTNCKRFPKTTNFIIGTKYISKKHNKIFDAYYMNIPKPPNPPKINGQNMKLQLIEVKPIYEGHKYDIHYKYSIETNEPIRENEQGSVEDFISIDLGIGNLMTIYNPTGEQQIVSGKYLVWLNKKYNHLIDEAKQKAQRINGSYTTKKIRNMLINRENKINDHFNRIVKWLENNYKEKKIIIGYNLNWKSKVNMGRKTNRRFYEIPYSKLLKKIKDKFRSNLILNEESYTSKCDGLALADIKKKDNYLGKRIRRGLYQSSVGKLINADLNGAINIMRKCLKKKEINMDRILGNSIFNPKKAKI